MSDILSHLGRLRPDIRLSRCVKRIKNIGICKDTLYWAGIEDSDIPHKLSQYSDELAKIAHEAIDEICS